MQSPDTKPSMYLYIMLKVRSEIYKEAQCEENNDVLYAILLQGVQQLALNLINIKYL